MDRQDLLDWLRFLKIPGLGGAGIRFLLEHLGSPRGILSASRKTFEAIPGIKPKMIDAFVGFRQTIPEEPLDHELNRLAAMGAKVVVYGDTDYPPLLTHIPDPPPVLFVQGDPGHLQPKRAVAIVGSRAASGRGGRFAYDLGYALAHKGVVVVSGLAVGIDAAAHHGALTAGGVTVAVIASGLDVDYPSANRELKKRVIGHGCVVTEAFLGTQPVAYLFPKRNRIISGLCQGVVIVEAAEKSGAMITANLALEQGREVFAVPGPIDDQRSKGVNKLLRQGACLIEGVADILSELDWPIGADLSPGNKINSLQNKTCGSSLHDCILRHLEDDWVQGDDLARRCQLTVGSLSSILLQLELSGIIERRPGNWFTLRKRECIRGAVEA